MRHSIWGNALFPKAAGKYVLVLCVNGTPLQKGIWKLQEFQVFSIINLAGLMKRDMDLNNSSNGKLTILNSNAWLNLWLAPRVTSFWERWRGFLQTTDLLLHSWLGISTQATHHYGINHPAGRLRFIADTSPSFKQVVEEWWRALFQQAWKITSLNPHLEINFCFSAYFIILTIKCNA